MKRKSFRIKISVKAVKKGKVLQEQMTKQEERSTEWQKHILAVLQYLQEGGDYKAAPGMLDIAKKDQLEILKTSGHPLNTLYLENSAISNLIENRLLPDLKKWQQDGKNQELLARLQDELAKLRQIKYHYKRKENSLYSFFVKYHLASESDTSALWQLDDTIRNNIKKAEEAVNNQDLPDKYVIEAEIEKAAGEVMWMIFIEETILFPLLNVVSSPKDWYMVKQDELEIGYTLIDLPGVWAPSKAEIDQKQLEYDNINLDSELVEAFSDFLHNLLPKNYKNDFKEDLNILKGDPSYPVGDDENGPALVFKDMPDLTVKMEIGSLSLKEIPAIFNVLPIDLTFVDKNDRVKWFSNSDRIFPRTRSVIGRPVIRCHPPKSMDKVLKILDDFHKGYADSQDFWVNVHGRTIYLCFYAVRDSDDNYLGCLETVQDVTKFKAISGEKMLENQEKFKDQELK